MVETSVLKKSNQLSPIVYIVDDDQGVRTSLEDLFASVGYDVITYVTPQEFLIDEKLERPGCLLLDIRLQGVNGLDFQDKLVRDGDKLPVILISGHGDIPMSVRGMKAGALDFIEKPFREQNLLDSVAMAINEWWRRKREQNIYHNAKEKFASLTPRETEIIQLVLAGRLSKQVADDLSISLVTVKIHRASAMRKLGVKSLVELTRLADAIGL